MRGRLDASMGVLGRVRGCTGARFAKFGCRCSKGIHRRPQTGNRICLRIGVEFLDTDVGKGHQKLSAYVWLHFESILMKMNKIDAYLNAPNNIHSYLDNFCINWMIFI